MLETLAQQQHGMSVEIIARVDEFARLGDEWNELASRHESPLTRHEWFLSCAEAFGEDGELSIVIVRDSGRLCAAAPLMRVPIHQGGGYHLLGVARLWEPSALLYDAPAALAELCRALVRLRRPIFFGRVSRDTNFAVAMRNACAGTGVLSAARVSPSPFLTVDRPWPEFLQSRSSRRRYDLRRAHKALEKCGTTRIEMLRPVPNDVDAVLADAFAIEASGWKGEKGSAMGVKPIMATFMRRYAYRAAQLGTLRVSFLSVEGRPIAMQIGVDWARRHWILKIGYDESWASASPGVVLMHETVRQVFEAGLVACEFLGSPEPWLRLWTRSAHPCRAVRYYPFSLAGFWGYVRRPAV